MQILTTTPLPKMVPITCRYKPRALFPLRRCYWVRQPTLSSPAPLTHSAKTAKVSGVWWSIGLCRQFSHHATKPN